MFLASRPALNSIMPYILPPHAGASFPQVRIVERDRASKGPGNCRDLPLLSLSAGRPRTRLFVELVTGFRSTQSAANLVQYKVRFTVWNVGARRYWKDVSSRFQPIPTCLLVVKS